MIFYAAGTGAMGNPVLMEWEVLGSLGAGVNNWAAGFG